jgi:iron complex outermembrane receptor protein
VYRLFLIGVFTGARLAAWDDPLGGVPKTDPFAEELPKVEAATLHAQTLDEAPADVTVITRAQIHTYGYRTLGEALAGVRGFYLSGDHIYNYVGVSGFSLPGDLNTRFLVMINGHAMTENIYSSNSFFGQDFGLDMDLVERIEVVRGPSSALYGSNGIFATINVVTVSPVDFPTLHATTEVGSFGQKKAMLAGSFNLGKGANLLVSAAVVNNTGRSLYIPDLGQTAIGMDGERAYHTFANLIWRNWNIVAFFNDRKKMVPVAWDYNANSVGSRGNYTMDGRGYIAAKYARSLGRGELLWESAYDSYHYKDRFDYIVAEGLLDQRSYASGDWLDSSLVYQAGTGFLGSLSAGLQANADLRATQYDREVYPQQLNLLTIDRPSLGVGLFVEDEKRISARWKLDFGARIDEARYYGHSFSPRAALTYQPSPRTVFKFIFGRPFRNPSMNEQFYYNNIGFLKPGPLVPERANTYEFVAEGHISPRLSATLHVYQYQIKDLIEAVYLDNGASVFENVPGSRSRGIEIEVRSKPRPWFETDGSLAWQAAIPQGSVVWFTNSPAYLAKFRWAVPAGSRMALGNSWNWMSSRTTYSGATVRQVLLADVTLTLRRVLPGFDVQAGIRNALNWSYADPVGLSVDTMPGDPRAVYFKLLWNPAR